MINYLEKRRKTHTDFILLKTDGKFLIIKKGKIGKSSSESVKNCGSVDKAVLALDEMSNKYILEGFLKAKLNASIEEPIIFDKAKWHLNNDFPPELDLYQAYVHTGFYIGWLIEKELISMELKSECEKEITSFLKKEITCVELYRDQLDGVFTSDEVNDTGLKFTKHYFDFSKGKYLIDYENTLAEKLPSLFHVKDTWPNFNAMSQIISNAFKDWVAY